MKDYTSLRSTLQACTDMQESLPRVKQQWEQLAWQIGQLPNAESNAEMIFDQLERDPDWPDTVARLSEALQGVQSSLHGVVDADECPPQRDQGGAEQQQQPAATKPPEEEEDAGAPYELPYSRPQQQQPEQPRPVERPKPSAGLQQRMQQRPTVASKPPAPPPKKGGKR